MHVLSPGPNRAICSPTYNDNNVLVRTMRRVGRSDLYYKDVFNRRGGIIGSTVTGVGLFLRNTDSFGVVRNSALHSPGVLRGKRVTGFSYIVTGPPFSLRG